MQLGTTNFHLNFSAAGSIFSCLITILSLRFFSIVLMLLNSMASCSLLDLLRSTEQLQFVIPAVCYLSGPFCLTNVLSLDFQPNIGTTIICSKYLLIEQNDDNKTIQQNSVLQVVAWMVAFCVIFILIISPVEVL